MYLHELVAKDIPNPNNYLYIEHINGSLLDNRRENLRWTDVKPKGYPEDTQMMKKHLNKILTSKQKADRIYKPNFL